MTLIAAYVRVSTDEQAQQGISIPAQKSRLLSYAQAMGWEIVDYYIDDGYSGKDLNRPEIQRLIRDAQGKKFNTVLFLKLDRLSRKQRDTLYLLEDVFEPSHIGIKSVTEAFDTTTPFGKAALGMMAVFAQLERETIVERVRLAKKESAKQGRFMGGPAPLGYDHDPVHKRLIVNEEQADLVRWIYDEYLKGERGYQGIVELLDQQGIPSPTGRKWNTVTMREILRNPVYIGMVKHNGELYKGQQPAIIVREKWDEAQSLLRKRGAIRAAAQAHDGLVSGIVYCGECGARMRYKRVWQNYPCTTPKKVMCYYVCYSQDKSSPHMAKDTDCRVGYKRAEEIEALVVDALCGFSFDKEALTKITVDTLSGNSVNDLTRMLNRCRKEVSTINKKLERWYSAFERNAISPDDLVQRIKNLREQKKAIETEIASLQEQIPDAEDRSVSVFEVLEILQNFPALWGEADKEERRGIVLNLIHHVKVFKDGRVSVGSM
ncbi:recombinase family protein [Heliobacterium undosum]|uniref:Recombinase family protein n=1 Tax=Heliomicrobium undosum TaxID=121734 RepID=A0A845L2X4_9FIRM|nr:recombinase family protein [Heliomicrobium undosum]MZP29365.1 recombinase family protein [Heliomicrobium undosum]